MNFRNLVAVVVFSAFLAPVMAGAVEQQAPARQDANTDPVYQELRHVAVSGPAMTVKDFKLQRDAGVFTFHDGTFYLVAPVKGKTTGAVFVGEGSFTLMPPTESERKSLSLLTQSSMPMTEDFSEAVLRFTDGTEAEIKKAGTEANVTYSGGYFEDVRNDLRHRLHTNLDGRILEDVLRNGPGATPSRATPARTGDPGGLFVAFIKGKHYSDKMIYEVDPHGALAPPEEVALFTYGANKTGIWTSFHLASEIASGTASGAQQNNVIRITHQQLNTRIEKSAYLDGDATTTFTAQEDGLRVVPFDLFTGMGISEGLPLPLGMGGLDIKSVSDSSGHPLSFIREARSDDPDYFVILPTPLRSGEEFTVRTVYGGKGAVTNEGSGNYYPVARENWYPNQTSGGLGNYATYDMTFSIPRGMTMVATGTLVKSERQGDEEVTHWHSDEPLTVAGFNFGKFKRTDGKSGDGKVEVSAFANEEIPDVLRSLQVAADGPLPAQAGGSSILDQPQVALGNMDTTSLVKKALGEGELSIQLYDDYFGPSSYSQLDMSQQTAGNYGQSWPGLVYLPLTSFLDETVRHQLGMGNADTRGYFRVVGPHEVAHQWWGHTVGFDSYRDQWMSEGFADFSAGLFLQKFYGMQKFSQFWDDELWLMTQRNKEGFRAADFPVTEGYRAANSRIGWDLPRGLIYPKGAYILQMVRMMMFDRKTGDDAFKDMMRDFVNTYRNRPATTENFKAMMEKHMTRAMDLDGNHKMDWFFNEYVYGTALPEYKLDYSFNHAASGLVMDLKITQSGVENNFAMLVPLYLEMGDGRVVRLGSATIRGNSTVQQQVPLTGLKDPPRKAMLNYLHDVLCSGG